MSPVVHGSGHVLPASLLDWLTDTSFYRSLNGQIMFPDPKTPLSAATGGAEERSDLRQDPDTRRRTSLHSNNSRRVDRHW